MLVAQTSPLFAAAPTITGVTGASNYVTTGQFTIYGGLAGIACGGDGTSTCSSCTPDGIATSTTGSICSTSPLCQCNETRIYDNLVVRITLQSTPNTTTTTPTTGVQQAYAIASTTTNTTKTPVTLNTATNGGTFIDFRWQTLCTLMGASSGATTCDTLFTGATGTSPNSVQLEVDIWIDTDGSGNSGPSTGEVSIPVYFQVVLPPADSVYGNANSDGIGAFAPFPGDGKIYLTNIQAASSFPNMSYGIAAQGVKVFISPNSEDDANYNKPPVSPATLGINSTDGTLANQIVDGLTNNQLYFFRLAIVDLAGNVVQYFPDSNGLDPSCTSASPSAACPYAATPTQVLGLLTKDLNCFVATAAYGSSLEPKLDTFRSFRRHFLLTNTWGRKFVDAYYNYGPRAARFIGDKPLARAAVRLGLWPLYGFSAFALRYGMKPALGLVFVVLTFLSMLLWFSTRRLFARE